jgi:hypothetical protein
MVPGVQKSRLSEKSILYFIFHEFWSSAAEAAAFK